MITINDTPLSDNLLIFVMRIYLDDGTLRYATREITLSTNVYSADVLFRVDFTTLSSISKDIYIANGGGVGSLSAMEFSLSNFSGKYIDEFYPSTSKPYLTSRKVDVGFLWSGATTEAEITWINSYYINSVTVEPNKITCLCIELSDFESKELPYYQIQQDFDNEISYFPYAPIENIGSIIPIIYGDFQPTYTQRQIFDVVYAPAICIDAAKLGFIFCSHEVQEPSYQTFNSKYVLLKYIRGVESYIECYNKDYDGVNVNSFRHYIELQDDISEILGSMYLKLGEKALDHNAGDVYNVIDNITTTYDLLEENGTGDAFLSLRVYGSASTFDVGYLSTDEVYMIYSASSSDGTSRNVGMRIRNEQLSSPGTVSSGTDTLADTTPQLLQINFAGITTSKKDGTLPWTIEEVCSLGYALRNNETTSGKDIRVYHGYIYLGKIRVINLLTKYSGYIQRLTPGIAPPKFTVNFGFRR